MDKRNLDATKKALLDAAEKLMLECTDISQVTSRAITKEAGVNLAMINYCFGSREALLFEVFEKIQAAAGSCDSGFAEIPSGEYSPAEKLIEVHCRTMKIMLQNYNISKAITKYVLINRAISGKRGSLQFIQEYFGDRKTEGECRLIAYELSGLHELAVLHHEEIKEVCGVDLKNDDELREYVTAHVKKFLEIE